MKTNKKNTAASAETENKKTELVTVNLHLEQMFQPDGTAFEHFDLLCPDWVPMPLYHEMADALKGLERVMAQTVVNCLVDCWTGRRLCLTGIRHIDMMLCDFYHRILVIAQEEGVTLEPIF